MTGVVVITGSGDVAERVRNAVFRVFSDATFIVEDAPDRRKELGKRIRRHGLLAAFGQVAFRAVLARKIARQKPRIDAIWREAGHGVQPIPDALIWRTADVNGADTISMLQRMKPKVVIICAVRKLRPATLLACAAPVLNLHPGITPAYRGVHTGYWALRRGDAARFGATVHFVDHGLDTGPVIEQIAVTPGAEDSIATYNHLIVAAGLDALLRAAGAVCGGTAPETRPTSPAAPLFHEPTLWNYILGGMQSKVW